MELNETIKELIAEIEKKGDVKAVFGDPIKEGNITIIPVANVAMSGGGGGGIQNDDSAESTDGKKMKGKGFGLGYMKKARPLGYIKIENDDVKFVPIIDWPRFAPLAIPIIGMGAIIFLKMMMKHKKHNSCPE